MPRVARAHNVLAMSTAEMELWCCCWSWRDSAAISGRCLCGRGPWHGSREGARAPTGPDTLALTTGMAWGGLGGRGRPIAGDPNPLAWGRLALGGVWPRAGDRARGAGTSGRCTPALCIPTPTRIPATTTPKTRTATMPGLFSGAWDPLGSVGIG